MAVIQAFTPDAIENALYIFGENLWKVVDSFDPEVRAQAVIVAQEHNYQPDKGFGVDVNNRFDMCEIRNYLEQTASDLADGNDENALRVYTQWANMFAWVDGGEVAPELV